MASTQLKILVVGAGAIGGYFGGRLLAAGRDVTFLVRPKRAAELAKNGLQVKSVHGDISLSSPPTILAKDISTPFDVILLSCKAQDLNDAMDSFARAVGTGTAILPMLNGMRHLDALDERFGREHVLGGDCFISAVLDAEGRILHLNDLHLLALGESQVTHSSRIEKIASAFSNAGFDAHLADDILQEMWEKWVFIATAAGITCLMRAAIGDIVAANGARLALRLLDECGAIAQREGYPPTVEGTERNRTLLTTAGSTVMASMLRDVERHAPTEADQILGDLLERGNRHGLASPMLELAYVHLKAYEARRRREGA
jgi:2-dehydropantoate 2-reductase